MPEIKLTPKDQAVIECLFQCCGNEEIGMRLGVKATTVKAHLNRIYMRAGITGGIKRVKLWRMIGDPESSARLPKLADKQLRIAQLIAQGLKDKEIGEALGTTEGVIKNHIRDLYDVLGVWDRLELAIRYGKALTERVM